MQTHEQIRRLLLEELSRARSSHEIAHKVFMEAITQIPSGLQQPDGTAEITHAGNDKASTMDSYMRALREFNDFIVHGTVPQRFRVG